MTDVDDVDADGRAALATAAARAGAAAALDRFRSGVAVETKATKNDLVTEADRSAQRRVVERLRSSVPDEPVVGEEGEGSKAVPETGPAWVVDPIDGTANYVRGLGIWTTSVAAVVDGAPVAAASVLPATGDDYTADGTESRHNAEPTGVSDRTDPETFAVSVLGWGPSADRSAYADLAATVIDRFGDVRRLGSMQAALAFVASGQLDAAITTGRPHPWDSIAGAHLVDRAGGRVTDGEGRPWRHDSDVLVASNGRAHGAVLDAAREARRSE
ncbi:MAG: inositol monophosphatase [Haloferacaceae archaeon]